MKRNKKLTAASLVALFAAAGNAQADVDVIEGDKINVDVYGVLDIAYGTVQHSLGINPQYSQSVNPVSPALINKTASAIAPSRQTGFFNGALQGPRLGIKGDYDLGPGLNAFFTLEEGVDLTSGRANNNAAAVASNGGVATTTSSGGSRNGQLFNRLAIVGLSSDRLGTVALGRNYAPIYDVVSKYDPVQFAQLFSPLGFSATYGGGGGVSEDALIQNSIKYSHKIGSFNFGAISNYRGAAGDSTAKTGYGFNVGYAHDRLGIQAAYQAFVDALNGSAGALPNTIKVSAYDTRAFVVALRYKISDEASLKTGYESYTLSAPSDPIALSNTNYYGQIVNAVTGNRTIAPRTTNILFIGGGYNFTEKLSAAAGLYSISMQQSADYTPTSAGNSVAKTGQARGNQRYLSIFADYHFTQRLDGYVGFMYGAFSGAAFPSAIYYSSNSIAATGVRYTF